MLNLQRVTGEVMVFLMVTLIIVSSVSAAVPEKMKDGLIFYASFDKSTKPEIAGGNSKTMAKAEWEFEESKIGQGLKVGKGCPGVGYYCDGNLLANKGTVSFWAKLWWEPGTGDKTNYKYFFGVAGGPILVIGWWGENKNIFFATFQGGNWAWGPNADISWIKPDKWHHFVFTWTKFEKKIYIDGEEEGKGIADTVLDTFAPGSYFAIGYHPTDNDKFAESTFDELSIWDRNLSPQEINELYVTYK